VEAQFTPDRSSGARRMRNQACSFKVILALGVSAAMTICVLVLSPNPDFRTGGFFC
jgi:hypothetical protein